MASRSPAPDPPVRWFRYYPPRTPPAPIEPVVRRLYEAGYHSELNKRLKASEMAMLAGVADIAQFSAAAGRDARWVVMRLAREVRLAR